MAEVVASLEAAFDLVVFDVPSVLPTSDTLALVEYVDGLVLMVGVGVTRKEQLRTSLDLLEKDAKLACSGSSSPVRPPVGRR